MEGTTLLKQSWACSTVDCTINASSAQQGLIGSVDNGINVHLGYVVTDYFYRHICHLFPCGCKTCQCSELSIILLMLPKSYLL